MSYETYNQLAFLREPDSPIPPESFHYVVDLIHMATVNQFEEYDLTDTPKNYPDFLKENREAIYEAFNKAEDLLLEELYKIIDPCAKEYSQLTHDLNENFDDDEEESEG